MAEPTEALDNFIGKWRARWPEWAVAEVFLPPAQRDLARAWATLQQELTDAAWGGSDPTPGEAKLAWWQEELAGWGRGARRHPLGNVLQRQPAPWVGLAATLPSLAASRDRPGTTEDAFASVRLFARAAAAVDAALAGSPAGDAHGELVAELVAATLLQWRLAQGEAGVPLAILARAGEGDAGPLWAAELRRNWPAHRAPGRPRRLWAALARARLEADPAKPPAGWRTLLTAWRAARG